MICYLKDVLLVGEGGDVGFVGIGLFCAGVYGCLDVALWEEEGDLASTLVWALLVTTVLAESVMLAELVLAVGHGHLLTLY